MGLCLLFITVTGCAGNEAVGEDAKHSINIVTTIYPLADIIEQLGSERVAVSYLLPAGASPHTYEPTVEQAKLIAKAQLFVYIGAGLDEWAVKLTETASPELNVVELADTLDLLQPGQYYRLDVEHGHEKTDHEDHDHFHGPADPHFWLDPLLVRDDISPRLHKELIALSPENTVYFAERLDEYHEQLTLLHEEIAVAVSGFSKHNFIAFHSGWQYFAQRYGLREVAVIAEFPGQEPSSGWMAKLIELVKDKQIGAVFTEPQFSSALADRISEESGSKVLVIDPLGGENLPGRESYLDLMRFNLSVFKEALE